MPLKESEPPAWVIIAEDGTQCSESADTVVLQSDDDDHIVCADTLLGMAQRAAMKKAAATCETCESRPVTNVTCLSGNVKLCEMCDLAEWAAELCSACGDCPALPQAQKKCPDQHLCLDCDDVCDIERWVQRHGMW